MEQINHDSQKISPKTIPIKVKRKYTRKHKVSNSSGQRLEAPYQEPKEPKQVIIKVKRKYTRKNKNDQGDNKNIIVGEISDAHDPLEVSLPSGKGATRDIDISTTNLVGDRSNSVTEKLKPPKRKYTRKKHINKLPESMVVSPNSFGNEVTFRVSSEEAFRPLSKMSPNIPIKKINVASNSEDELVVKRLTSQTSPATLSPSKLVVEGFKERKPSDLVAPLPSPTSRMNEKYIQLMYDLAFIMRKRKDMMRARAYDNARETIENVTEDIISPDQLKGRPGIGVTIFEKLKIYTETGTIPLLDNNREILKTKRAMDIFTEIYGVGEKKAEEIVEKGVTTLDELRARQSELLNDKQRIGLQYYEDIMERIPRAEIIEYENIFKKSLPSNMKMEIVGSYRRGLSSSGDIDVILSSSEPNLFKLFLDELKTKNIIVEILSCGNSKCLVITRLPGGLHARRVDFLYTSIDEFPFAILYFTGSKGFNTKMRENALSQGYTLNEHGMSRMEGKKKGALVETKFPTEKSIFDFLTLVYKTPAERTGSEAVVSENNTNIQVNHTNSSGDRRSPSELVEQRLTSLVAPLPKIKKNIKKKIIIHEKASGEGPTFLVDSSPPDEFGQGHTERVASSLLTSKATESERKPDKFETSVCKIVSEVAIENIRMFQQRGITVLDKLNENELGSMIDTANNAFHCIGEPIMTDAEYDIVHEYIEDKYPKSEVLKEVGAQILKNKATLPYEMASMDKIKPDTGSLPSWMAKYKGPYVISAKLDGVSGLYTTEGSEPKLYTRGDGKVGQDISYMIPHLKLPKSKQKTEPLVIRGEFIIKREIFDTKYKQKYANSRNLVAGIVNAKSLDDKVRDVDFVAYEVIKPSNLSPSQQMEKLANLNVIPVQNLTITPEKLTNEYLSNLLQEWRTNHTYEIDGIIVSDDHVYPRVTGNPDHSFAFKMVLSDQIAETHVIDVEWTASKDGYLKPIVHVQPVNVGGVTIKKATGFNADFIEKNKIGVGAIVQIIRSGDVIPYIKSVTKQATSPKMPLIPYTWNTTHIDIMLENAQEDMGVRTKQITGFFQALGVEGIGEGNVKKMVQAGFDRICKITAMSESDFVKVEGFQEKSAKKFVSGIREKIEMASLPLLMSASNIFGRGFGQRKTELIMKNYPNVLDTQERDSIKVAKIEGMARKTAEEFVSRIPAFIEFLHECNLEDKLTRTEASNTSNETMDTSHPLYEKSVITTGFRSKELEERLKKVGAKIGNSVNKSTFAVIVKDKESTSGKSQEARTLGIPVFTEAEFVTNYLLTK